ncbi:GGDEF domain-like protein [Shewanella amazonensis SB2B]|uniref:diguanylate cyclase n=1 Tax=Shewanella amazonensis (strain ATCC BAA-1098 / SB2B) TaxID=326297 RepID=A1S852_SHEAM|nr:GGDEF domain-containing protein [Shewanella amazonensis]ABM00559.1 GGDEF domain-like protein [Shewanella amazonensis SB2B]
MHFHKQSGHLYIQYLTLILGLLYAALYLKWTEHQPQLKHLELLLESVPVLFWLVIMFSCHYIRHLTYSYVLLLSGAIISFFASLMDWLDEITVPTEFAFVEDVLQSIGLLLSATGLLLLFHHQLVQQSLLKKIAATDPLTGALNRRAFKAPKTHSGSTVFALVDVDHFKRINDTYGHDAGDFVLVELAKLISNHIREDDQFFRWGGEEFLLEFRQAELAQASKRMEALRQLVESSHFNLNGQAINITISAGLTCVSPNHGGLEKALKAADEALYRAKDSGRNRIEVAV